VDARAVAEEVVVEDGEPTGIGLTRCPDDAHDVGVVARDRVGIGRMAVGGQVADVVATLRFAKRHKLRFTVKGVGHSATGYSLNTGGIVLDFSLMKRMVLEGETLRVQTGARWIDVYRYLQTSGNGLISIGGG